MTPAFVAALVVSSLTYLVGRARFTRPWIERVPLFLDLSLVIGVAAGGVFYLNVHDARLGLLYGLLIALACTGVIVLHYGIVWAISFLPPFSPFEEVVDLPGLEVAQARKILARRLTGLGYLVDDTAEGDRIAARFTGNKVAWPRKLRPKTIRIELDAREGGGVKARIRVRYVLPRWGLTRNLRPFAEEVVSPEEPASDGTGDAADLATKMWLPVEAIVVGLLVLTFLILWLWALRS